MDAQKRIRTLMEERSWKDSLYQSAECPMCLPPVGWHTNQSLIAGTSGKFQGTAKL